MTVQEQLGDQRPAELLSCCNAFGNSFSRPASELPPSSQPGASPSLPAGRGAALALPCPSVPRGSGSRRRLPRGQGPAQPLWSDGEFARLGVRALPKQLQVWARPHTNINKCTMQIGRICKSSAEIRRGMEHEAGKWGDPGSSPTSSGGVRCCCGETCSCAARFRPGAHPDVALRRARVQHGARRCRAKEARASLISIPIPHAYRSVEHVLRLHL